MGQAVILHIDMDSFFVSVERLFDPSLIGVPVAVGSDARRSVVSSASYEARKFGVRSAMPVEQAKQKCPHLVLVSPHFERYQLYSQRVFEIFNRYTPLVEKLGIDEGFLDITGSLRLFGSHLQIAEQIRSAVRTELGLPCSVGIAPNKFLAKLASVKAKPDGVFVIPPTGVSEFLFALPLSDLYGIGPKTVAKLKSRAIYTVADVLPLSEQSLISLLGKAGGKQLYNLARGRDPRLVTTARETKSISKEHTFEFDVRDAEVLHNTLLQLVESVARRLRRKTLIAGSVSVTARRSDFQRVRRQITLSQPTNSTKILFSMASELFNELHAQNAEIRLLGVGAGNLQAAAQRELLLWEEAEDSRWKALDAVSDSVQDKFGLAALRSARALQKRHNAPN